MRALLAAILLVAAMVGPAHAVTYPCATGNVQVETQAWWQDAAGEAWPGRHIHQQLCWPTGVVSGTFTRDVRILLHAQPTGARITRIRITDGGGATMWSKTSGFPAFNGGDLSFTVTMSFSTSRMSSGAHEMRLATIVRQPSGVDQFVSSAHLLWVRSTSGGTDRRWHEARGWYPRFEYVNARTKTPLANFREMTAGETFHAQCASPSGHNGTGCGVFVDPNAHAGFPGTLVGPWVNGEASRTLAFPSLSPGLHKLMIRHDSKANLGGVSNGTNSGVFVVTVLVP